MRNRKIAKVLNRLEKFRVNHKNLIFLFASFVLFYVIITREGVAPLIESFGNFGYIGGFVCGFLFSYGFSTLPAASTLFFLGQSLNIFLLALIGAVGAMIGDIFIFRFVRDSLGPEIKYIIANDLHINLPPMRALMTSRLKSVFPAVAGLIMALPLPGEFAMVILGSIKYDMKKVALMTFSFNFVGILMIGLIGTSFH